MPVMKRYLMLIMCLLALSCTDKLAELEIVEFGAQVYEEYEMPLSYRSGEIKLEIVSDGEYDAVVTEGTEWIRFENGSASYKGSSADECLVVCYDANRTVMRSGKVVLSRRHRKVEIEISQVGILSVDFTIGQQNLSIGADGGFLSSKVLTLASPDDILIETVYLEAEQGEWITQAKMENNYLKFNIVPNTSPEARHAVIKVSKKGTSMSGDIQVTQEGTVGYESKTIADIMDMAENTPKTITSHIKLSDAIIINDNVEGNGAENRNVTPTIQDLTLADRTLYVSDAAGSAGIKLEFVKGAELLVRRFDHVDIDLHGAVLVKESDPLRYIIKEVPAAAIMTSREGSESDVTVKVKKISELTDADIYTLVELTDCEIPIRKGPYVPINLKHYSVINKYPMVIRDKEGSDMYMVINTTCTWHRNRLMPQGSGPIRGVIVHEHCDNFEWDQNKAAGMMAEGLGLNYINDIGEIGRYQIRPVKENDIMIDPEFENGFSQLVCEFRYAYDGDKMIKNLSGGLICYPSVTADKVKAYIKEIVPEGKDQNDKALKATLTKKRDWTMVGSIKDGKLSSVAAGNGVWDDNGILGYWYVSPAKQNNAMNEGRVDLDYGSAWSMKNLAYGSAWQIAFSTEGLAEVNKPLSVQFGIINGYGERIGGPVNWVMEYSLDKGQTWNQLNRFTVPDFSLNGNKQVWNCPGHKNMSFTIDDSISKNMWGKEEVLLKLRPFDLSAGKLGSYSGGTIPDEIENSLNYFAVRCNKSGTEN